MRVSRILWALTLVLVWSWPAQAKDKFTLALNWNVPYSGWVGFYVAKAKGYYDAEDLDVEFLLVKGSNPANQAVAAGSAQMGVSTASSVMVAASKGLPLVAVSAFMQSNPEGVIVRQDSGIEKLSDFPGKRIAINPANPTVFMFEAKLARAGVDKTEIDFLNVQPEAMVPLIVKGEVQGGLGYWDWQAINIRKEGVPVNVFVMSDDEVQIYGNVVSANRDWLPGHEGVVKRFLRASVKGWIDAFDDPKLGVDTMLASNPEEDRDFMEQAVQVSIKLIGSPDATEKGFGWMDAADWQGLQDALLAGKVISSPVDISGLFTNDMLPDNAKDWGKRM